MATFQRSVNIQAEPQAVWDVLKDFGNIQNWATNVKESHWTSESRSGVGCERFCDFGMGMNVLERVSIWREQQELKVVFPKFMFPVHEASSHFELTPSPEGTVVVFTMAYRPKGFGRFMALMGGRSMPGSIDELLADLKKASEKKA